MAVLGYSTKGGSAAQSLVGGIFASKFTLATPMTMTELHIWVKFDSGGTVVIHLYGPSGSNPGARIAYTSPITTTVGGDYHASQTGFSVPLTAGDYWLGFSSSVGGGSNVAYFDSIGTHARTDSGVAYPTPPATWPTPGSTGVRQYSVWAVVNPASTTPVADFTGTPLTGTAPLSVAFTDSSTNTPTSWAWTFGDGGTSTAQNPTHSYTAAGTYTVALVATNAAGSNTKTRTGYVTVSTPVTPPTANFSAAPTAGVRPLTVVFIDTSTA